MGRRLRGVEVGIALDLGLRAVLVVALAAACACTVRPAPAVAEGYHGTVETDGRDFGRHTAVIHASVASGCRVLTRDGEVLEFEVRLDDWHRNGTIRIATGPGGAADATRGVEVDLPWTHLGMASSECPRFEVHPRGSPQGEGSVHVACRRAGANGDTLLMDLAFRC
jgi:hypothetical protein